MNVVIILVLLLSGCIAKIPDKLLLKPSSFDDLHNWNNDNQLEAFRTFKTRCASFKYDGTIQFQQIYFNKICQQSQIINIKSMIFLLRM